MIQHERHGGALHAEPGGQDHLGRGVLHQAVNAMCVLPQDQAQALNPHTGQVTQPSAWTRGPPQSGQARERGMTMVRMRMRRVM